MGNTERCVRMVFTPFSAIEQLYGVANYGKAVWFKKMLGVIIPSIWRRLGAGGSASSLPASGGGAELLPRKIVPVTRVIYCKNAKNLP